MLVYDRQLYLIFSRGQLRVRTAIGAGEKTYDTFGIMVEKHMDDVFRHWLLGFGSGDMTVRTAGTNAQQFKVANVLQIGRKLELIQQMLQERAVVGGPSDPPFDVPVRIGPRSSFGHPADLTQRCGHLLPCGGRGAALHEVIEAGIADGGVTFIYDPGVLDLYPRIAAMHRPGHPHIRCRPGLGNAVTAHPSGQKTYAASSSEEEVREREVQSDTIRPRTP